MLLLSCNKLASLSTWTTNTFFKDGSSLSETGTAVFPRKYTYGLDLGSRVRTEIRIGDNGEETESKTDYTDSLGRHLRTTYAGGAMNHYAYWPDGKLGLTIDPDGKTTWYPGHWNFERVELGMTTKQVKYKLAGLQVRPVGKQARYLSVLGTQIRLPKAGSRSPHNFLH